MGINSGDFDSLESGSISQKVSESKDQYQERSRAAQVQLKKIQKDEKKSQGDNQKLFLVLSRFIEDEYFFSLVPTISGLLSANVPSRGIIAFISLFYPDATYYVLEILGEKNRMNQFLSLHRYEEMTPFDEATTHADIRTWMQVWISLMDRFLLHPDASVIMIKKLHFQMHTEEKKRIESAISDFLVFFFAMRNVQISTEKAREYARFIGKNLVNTLEIFLKNIDKKSESILEDSRLSNEDLFR